MARLDQGWEPTEVHVDLRIYCGDVDPDTITAELGLVPDSTRVRGVAVGRRKPALSSGWSLDSRGAVPADATLEAHLTWLLDRIEPVRDRIAALARRHVVYIHAGFMSDDPEVTSELSPSTLSRIGACGLQVELDLMWFSESE